MCFRAEFGAARKAFEERKLLAAVETPHGVTIGLSPKFLEVSLTTFPGVKLLNSPLQENHYVYWVYCL
jgi:hypothetical protein